MSVDIIHDFVKYQIEWLTSHNDLEFEPVIEDAIVQMLKDTGKSFIDEQPDETSQFDHIADSDRKVEQTAEIAQNVQNEDLILRKAAIEALGKDPGFKVKLFGKSYDEGRSDQWFKDVHALTALPSVQPEIIRCKDCKHWRFDHTCREHSLVSPMMANEFCSRAERREG